MSLRLMRFKALEDLILALTELVSTLFAMQSSIYGAS